MRSQSDILLDAVADLYKQLSLSLSRESELRDINANLANRLAEFGNIKPTDIEHINPAASKELAGKDQSND